MTAERDGGESRERERKRERERERRERERPWCSYAERCLAARMTTRWTRATISLPRTYPHTRTPHHSSIHTSQTPGQQEQVGRGGARLERRRVEPAPGQGGGHRAARQVPDPATRPSTWQARTRRPQPRALQGGGRGAACQVPRPVGGRVDRRARRAKGATAFARAVNARTRGGGLPSSCAARLSGPVCERGGGGGSLGWSSTH